MKTSASDLDQGHSTAVVHTAVHVLNFVRTKFSRRVHIDTVKLSGPKLGLLPPLELSGIIENQKFGLRHAINLN
jgi:hypothetical protein